MATGLLRIAAPGVVLLVFFYGLGTAADAPEAAGGRVSGELSIDQGRALAEEADALVSEGRAADALDQFRQLHHAFPNNTIYVWYLAEAQRAHGDHLAAAESLELYMDQAPLAWAACR